MEYLALYRKYRPQKYDEIYGQEAIVQTLKNVVKNKKTSHAYLFVGPRGTGKTTVARIFSKAINCLENTNGESCEKCDTCKKEKEYGNPDVIELDAASNNGVDEIREIKEKVNMLPAISKYKIYIVDEVHMLSQQAFNALLKTLEEPPKHIIFILATTEPQKIPETIISRCQRFDFNLIGKNEIFKCIKNISQKEKIKISDEAIEEIAYVSKGGMRDAIGLLDQLSIYSDNSIDLKNIIEITRLISKNEVNDIVLNIYNKEIGKIIKKSEELEVKGADFLLVMEKISDIILNDILEKYKTKEYSILDYEKIEILNKITNQIKQSDNKKVNFEIGLITLLNVIEENNGTKRQEDIIINNILVKAKKQELIDVNTKWKNIYNEKEDNGNQKVLNILKAAKPVAASEEGMLVSIEDDADYNFAVENKEEIKKVVSKIVEKEVKTEFINKKAWESSRELFLEKIKNGEIKYINL